MAKQDAWESAMDPSVTEDRADKSHKGRKLVLVAGVLALVGAGVALTRSRRARA